MMGKKNKKRNRSKKSIERAAKKVWRKEKRRDALGQIKSYMKMRRNFKKPSSDDVEEANQDSAKDASIKLDESLTIHNCDGVGQCCLDRPFALEPGDVLRIMKNEELCEKLGIKQTQDLYRKDDTGKPMLIRVFDERSGLPACFAVPVLLGDDDSQSACPFYVHSDAPSCLLGDGRFTQCKADPIVRVARMNGKRQISGWSYALNATPCMSCSKAVGEMRVCTADELLIERDMGGIDGRFTESDTYTAFCDWIKREKLPMPLNRMAVELLYNWNAVVEENPKNAIEHISSTRMMIEQMKLTGWADKFKEGNGEGAE